MKTAAEVIATLNMTSTATTVGYTAAQVAKITAEIDATLAAGWDGLEVGTVVNYKGNRAMIKSDANSIEIVDLIDGAGIVAGKIKGQYKSLQIATASDANKEGSVAKSILVKRMTLRRTY